jgi:hypothetical protein
MSFFNPEIAAKALLPKDVAASAATLHLAIHINPALVQVAVVDRDSNREIWVEKFDILNDSNSDLSQAIDFVKHCNWGEKVFRKTTISFDNADFVLVPQGFLVPGKERELLEFSTRREADCPETYMIPEISAGIVYDLPINLQGLASRFPNVRFFPSSGLFLRHTVSVANDSSGFHVLVQHGYMLVIAFHEGQVKLTNHYGIQGNDDVLYHVANAAMRLGIHLESTNLSLYGASVSGELKELIEGYVGSVNFWNKGDHNLFSVLIHSLCV